MPEKLRFEPQDNLTGQDFAFRKNKDMATTQANETFVVDARFNRSLGSNGETLGFAKRQYAVDENLQVQRQAAANKLDNAYGRLTKEKSVINWNKDRRELEDVSTSLEWKKADLGKNVKELENLRNEESPDAAKIANKEQIIGQITESLADLQKLYDNRELETARLIEVYKQTPAIQKYVATVQAQRAAASLVESTNSIAESSSWLYDSQRDMMLNNDLGGDRQLLTRAVASHEVDKLIGLNVCAEEKFAISAEHGLMGVSLQCDGAGVRSEFGKNAYGETTKAFLDINYANANIQKGLSDLEVLDYITGQTDRHAGNMFVDPESGKVTGIDNDLAFPEIERDVMLERAGPALSGKAVANMPKMMHTETAAKIKAMDPVALRNKLASIIPPNGTEGLSSKEIGGAVERLQELKDAISLAEKGEGTLEIVPEFNKETYARAIAAQPLDAPVTSYIGAVEKERVSFKHAIDTGKTTHCMRDEESVGKAKINFEYAAYKKLNTDEQKNYRNIQASVDQLEASLEAVRNDMAKLDHPGMKDRLAALKHGGMNGTRQHLLAKETALVKELTSRMNGLHLITAPYVGPMQEAEEKAKARIKAATERKDISKYPFLALQAPTPPRLPDYVNPPPPQPPTQAAMPKTAEEEQDVVDLDDDLETDVKVEAEQKKEDLAKKPSVAEMLKRSASAPQLGRQGPAQAAGNAEPKQGGKTLRESGSWQAATPAGPKPGGGALSAAGHPRK